jgi:exosortase H (IPTLxxWG-CTERM-specific)
MVRFLILFLVLLAVLFGLELTPWGQTYFVMPWTNALAHFCAQLVALVDESAVATGKVLRSTANGFAVSIEAGCNGIEATIILLAAVLAFPSTIKQKLWGLAIGFLAIQSLNVVRIISLFYIGQWNKTAFDWAHLHIWPALIILDALIFFMIWLRVVTKRQADDQLPPPSGGPGETTPNNAPNNANAQPA